MADTITKLFVNTGEFVAPHTVILDRLNFWHTNNGKRVYYDSTEFERALPLLTDVPIVFAEKHPLGIGSMPLEDAIKAVNGKLVGTSGAVFINQAGSPKLQSEIGITDPEVDELIKKGKVYISNAFTGKVRADNTIIDIVGNHILLFPTDTGINPNDQAALFLNQEGTKMAEDTIPQQKEPSTEFFMNQYEAQVKIVAEKDIQLKEQTELITNQETKITELEGALEEIKKAQKAEARKLFLNQFAPAIQTEYEPRLNSTEDPDEVFKIVTEMAMAQAKVPKVPDSAKQAGGNPIFANQEPDENDPSEIMKEITKITGR